MNEPTDAPRPGDDDSPLIEQPEPTLAALLQAVELVAPECLPELQQDTREAFDRAHRAGDIVALRQFFRKWLVKVEIARHPEIARRLREAESAMGSANPEVRERAVREAGDIVRAAHRVVADREGDTEGR